VSTNLLAPASQWSPREFAKCRLLLKTISLLATTRPLPEPVIPYWPLWRRWLPVARLQVPSLIPEPWFPESSLSSTTTFCPAAMAVSPYQRMTRPLTE
jgi:hypothetical protein